MLYAAENAVNAAACSGGSSCRRLGRPEASGCLDVRDTVIGKMSGVIDDPAEIAALGPRTTITPGLQPAFLVEAFDRILVSRVDPGGGTGPSTPASPCCARWTTWPPSRPPSCWDTTPPMPWPASRHAAGPDRVADLEQVPGAMAFLRAAFLEESGGRSRRGSPGADPLFTADGYAAFADDLLARMVNPHLADTIERASRDPRRKLGWDDRLVGTIRVCMSAGIEAPRYALGTAAGLAILEPGVLDGRVPVAVALRACWPADGPDSEAAQQLAGLVADGLDPLRRIIGSGRVSP